MWIHKICDYVERIAGELLLVVIVQMVNIASCLVVAWCDQDLAFTCLQMV